MADHPKSKIDTPSTSDPYLIVGCDHAELQRVFKYTDTKAAQDLKKAHERETNHKVRILKVIS